MIAYAANTIREGSAHLAESFWYNVSVDTLWNNNQIKYIKDS